MLLTSTHTQSLDQFADRIHRTSEPCRDLINTLIENTCTRLRLIAKGGKVSKLQGLLEAGAWTEAAFAVIELELPGWTLRRLVHDDGAWTCSLSRERELPMERDHTVADGTHESLALAIWAAIVEAHGRTADPGRAFAMPHSRMPPGFAVCCDNFS